jgi:hypothetical protein
MSKGHVVGKTSDGYNIYNIEYPDGIEDPDFVKVWNPKKNFTDKVNKEEYKKENPDAEWFAQLDENAPIIGGRKDLFIKSSMDNGMTRQQAEDFFDAAYEYAKRKQKEEEKTNYVLDTSRPVGISSGRIRKETKEEMEERLNEQIDEYGEHFGGRKAELKEEMEKVKKQNAAAGRSNADDEYLQTLSRELYLEEKKAREKKQAEQDNALFFRDRYGGEQDEADDSTLASDSYSEHFGTEEGFKKEYTEEQLDEIVRIRRNSLHTAARAARNGDSKKALRMTEVYHSLDKTEDKLQSEQNKLNPKKRRVK